MSVFFNVTSVDDLEETKYLHVESVDNSLSMEPEVLAKKDEKPSTLQVIERKVGNVQLSGQLERSAILHMHPTAELCGWPH